MNDASKKYLIDLVNKYHKEVKTRLESCKYDLASNRMMDILYRLRLEKVEVEETELKEIKNKCVTTATALYNELQLKSPKKENVDYWGSRFEIETTELINKLDE